MRLPTLSLSLSLSFPLRLICLLWWHKKITQIFLEGSEGTLFVKRPCESIRKKSIIIINELSTQNTFHYCQMPGVCGERGRGEFIRKLCQIDCHILMSSKNLGQLWKSRDTKVHYNANMQIKFNTFFRIQTIKCADVIFYVSFVFL